MQNATGPAYPRQHKGHLATALHKSNETISNVTGEQTSSGNYGLVWIHGAGFYHWQPLMDYSLKNEQQKKTLRTSYPKAPMAHVTAWGPNAPEGVSWYDMKFLPIGSKDNPPGYGCSLDDAKNNLPIIHAAIDEMVMSGVPAGNIVIAGMSQGGYMALRAALTYPEKLGGAFVYAGMLMYPDELKQQISTENENLSIEWLHGTNDDVLFVSMQDVGVSHLRSMGCKVAKSTCSAKHESDPALYARLGAFLDRIMHKSNAAQGTEEGTKERKLRSSTVGGSRPWLLIFCLAAWLSITEVYELHSFELSAPKSFTPLSFRAAP